MNIQIKPEEGSTIILKNITNYQELVMRVKTVLGLELREFKIYYIDFEHDKITISTQVDFQIFVSDKKADCAPLIYIETLAAQQPDRPLARQAQDLIDQINQLSEIQCTDGLSLKIGDMVRKETQRCLKDMGPKLLLKPPHITLFSTYYSMSQREMMHHVMQFPPSKRESAIIQFKKLFSVYPDS